MTNDKSILYYHYYIDFSDPKKSKPSHELFNSHVFSWPISRIMRNSLVLFRARFVKLRRRISGVGWNREKEKRASYKERKQERERESKTGNRCRDRSSANVLQPSSYQNYESCRGSRTWKEFYCWFPFCNLTDLGLSILFSSFTSPLPPFNACHANGRILYTSI